MHVTYTSMEVNSLKPQKLYTYLSYCTLSGFMLLLTTGEWGIIAVTVGACGIIYITNSWKNWCYWLLTHAEQLLLLTTGVLTADTCRIIAITDRWCMQNNWPVLASGPCKIDSIFEDVPFLLLLEYNIYVYVSCDCHVTVLILICASLDQEDKQFNTGSKSGQRKYSPWN